jgi:hypothetical protein
MDNKPNWVSAFDKHHKLEHPSADFSWERISVPFKKNINEVVCEGFLQELEDSTSALYAAKYYVATCTRIYRFEVNNSLFLLLG